MENRRLEITVISAKDIKDVNYISKMDVYIVVSIKGDSRSNQTTPVHRDGGTNPSWNTPMGFSFQDSAALSFKLRCQRKLGDKDIGEVLVSINDLLLQAGGSQAMQSVTLPVIKPSGKSKGELTFLYKFSEISVSPEPQAPVTDDTAPAAAVPAAVPGAPVGVNPLAPVEVHRAHVLANPPLPVYTHAPLPWSVYLAAVHQPQRNYRLRPLVGGVHATPTASALFGWTSTGASINANPPSHPDRINYEYSTPIRWYTPVRPPHGPRPEVQRPEPPQPEVQPLHHEEVPPEMQRLHPTKMQLQNSPEMQLQHSPEVEGQHPTEMQLQNSPEIQLQHSPEVEGLHPPEVERWHPTEMQQQNSPEIQLQHSPEVEEQHPPEVQGRHPSKMPWRRRMYWLRRPVKALQLDMHAVVMALLGGTSAGAHRLST